LFSALEKDKEKSADDRVEDGSEAVDEEMLSRDD